MSKTYKKVKKQYLTTGVKRISPIKTPNLKVVLGTIDNPYHIIIQGDTRMNVTVHDNGYYSKTPDFRKGKEKWIYQMLTNHKPNFTQKDIGAKKGRTIGIRVVKRLCGSAIGWVEAFHTYPENSFPNGFYFSGECPSRITKAEWRWYQKDNKGTAIGGSNVLYGDTIQLHIETEGLNGDYVEVSFKEDETNTIIDSTEGKTFNGYLILNVPIKTVWRSKLFNIFEQIGNDVLNITPILSYKNHYTGIKGEFEAPPIKIQNKVSERNIAKGSAVPVTVGKVATNPLKYNPCTYSKITIKQDKREDYLFFDANGKLLNQEKPYQIIAGGKESHASKLDIFIDALKTNPDVQCIETDGHKGNIFVYNDEFKKWVKEEKDTALKLAIQYQYPDLSLKGKSASSVLTDYAQNIIMPVEYIWPARKSIIQKYNLQANTCRYSKKIFLEVYPDIEWTFLFSIKKDNPLAYKHANMPPGNIYKSHQEIVRKTGYDKWYIGKHAKNRFELGLGLGAEWDNQEAKLGTDWKAKFETLAGVFQKAYEMADKVKNGAGGKMKKSSVPVGFEIMSPAVEANINWKMVAPKKGHEVAIEGKLDFKASPLVGAKLIIDLLAAASNLNPAAKIIYNTINKLVDDLSKYVTFTLEFYGQLDIEFNGLTLNSITGIDGGETIIKGKMGVKLLLELDLEAKVESWGTKIKMGFSAEAKADAYFGGDFKIDADDKGIYTEPVLKFSGLLVKAKITVYVGKLKKTLKLEDKNGNPVEVVDKEEWSIGKKYLT